VTMFNEVLIVCLYITTTATNVVYFQVCKSWGWSLWSTKLCLGQH